MVNIYCVKDMRYQYTDKKQMVSTTIKQDTKVFINNLDEAKKAYQKAYEDFNCYLVSKDFNKNMYGYVILYKAFVDEKGLVSNFPVDDEFILKYSYSCKKLESVS